MHDIKYDFYGKHVATASSDQHVKVFELDTSSSAWVLNDLWKAHDSLVVKLSRILQLENPCVLFVRPHSEALARSS